MVGAVVSGMTREERIEAALVRAEAACVSRDRGELLMAQAVLMGSLDHDAKQDAGDGAWVRAALKSVCELLAELQP